MILDTEIARHRRQKQPLGLALLDVDHFKNYNDSLGHQSGDDCLRQIAKAIDTSTRRPGEVVARYGGEEFVVIIPDCSADDALRYGQWICQAVSELGLPHPASACGVVTMSVGIMSLVPDDDTTARHMLEQVDRALYCSKNAGRNRVSISPA